MFKDIQEFHKKFGIEYKGSPRQLPQDISDFRIKFMQEELDEYTDAKTLDEKFDALIDLVYVALGAAHLHGFPFNKGWLVVHRANMKKIRATKAEQSKRGYASDVIKPDGWQPPDIDKVLRDHIKLLKMLERQQSNSSAHQYLMDEGDH